MNNLFSPFFSIRHESFTSKRKEGRKEVMILSHSLYIIIYGVKEFVSLFSCMLSKFESSEKKV